MKTFNAYIPCEGKRSLVEFQVKAETEEQAIEIATAEAIGSYHTVIASIPGWKKAYKDEPQYAKAFEAGLRKEYPIHVSFHEVEKESGIELPTGGYGYCTSYREGKRTYTWWEDNIASPFLEWLGYSLEHCWVSGDADSFGPLERHILVQKDGYFYEVYYG